MNHAEYLNEHARFDFLTRQILLQQRQKQRQENAMWEAHARAKKAETNARLRAAPVDVQVDVLVLREARKSLPAWYPPGHSARRA